MAQETHPKEPAASPDRPEESGAKPAVATKPAPARPAPKPTVQPGWKVLLHNDDVNEMGYVVETVSRIARINVPAATRCMVEAHRKGISLVTVTHRERAEFLEEQFRSCRLKVTIEPDA
jgi:ATP-dependent Clp protease adaptor protein ClpS